MAITSDLDRVRLYTGDTNEDDPLLYDEEITALLADRTIDEVANVYAAAADAARAIAAKFSRGFNFSEDGQSFNRSERVAHYMALSEDLCARSGAGLGSIALTSSVIAARDDYLASS